MKAWVISVTSINAYKPIKNNVRVISLVSARKNTDYIKQYIENIYSIFFMNLDRQREASKYTHPYIPIQATSHWRSVVYCVSQSYIFQGELSKIIGIREQDGVYWVKWKGVKYQIYDVDPVTHYPFVSKEVDPPITEAPKAGFQIRSLFT